MPESDRIGESVRYFATNQPMHYGIQIVYSLEVEHCNSSVVHVDNYASNCITVLVHLIWALIHCLFSELAYALV